MRAGPIGQANSPKQSGGEQITHRAEQRVEKYSRYQKKHPKRTGKKYNAQHHQIPAAEGAPSLISGKQRATLKGSEMISMGGNDARRVKVLCIGTMPTCSEAIPRISCDRHASRTWWSAVRYYPNVSHMMCLQRVPTVYGQVKAWRVCI